STLPEDVAAEVLLLAAAELGESRTRRGAAQRAVRRLVGSGPPRRGVRLGRLSIERSGRWLRVGPAALPALVAHRWEVPGALDLTALDRRLEARCFERSPDYAPPREAHRVAFDADRMPSALLVRSRCSGDRFFPFRGGGERRLKSFLIDAGVPRWERARIPLLEARGEIVWVVGLRRGQAAPVAPETKRILEVTLK
ncbi:MAG: tRNA lysidine(34) synthetase TilS, partial [Gemmatimonadales bacterium]